MRVLAHEERKRGKAQVVGNGYVAWAVGESECTITQKSNAAHADTCGHQKMSHSPLHVLHDIDSLTLVGRDDSNLLRLDPSSQELCNDLLHSSRLTSAWQP